LHGVQKNCGDPMNQSGEQFAGGGKKAGRRRGEEAEGDENPGEAARLRD